MYQEENVSTLLGKTLVTVERRECDVRFYEGGDMLIFITTDGEEYKMYHAQDCCESVTIEDIIGDLDDLVGSPITMSEVITEEGERDEWDDTSTWTFYKFATLKGYVTIRWYGTSNGYYSETVDFVKVK